MTVSLEAPPAAPRPADSVGAALIEDTARVLAELMVIGLLDHANTPDKVPGLLLPDLPAGPERDRALFVLGAVVGAAAGRRHTQAGQASVARARALLEEAGFAAMADLVQPRPARRPRRPVADWAAR